MQIGLVLSLLPVRKNGLYHVHVFCQDLVRDAEILFVGPRREQEKSNETVNKSIGAHISRVNRQTFQLTGKERESEDPVSDTKIPRAKRRSKLASRSALRSRE